MAKPKPEWALHREAEAMVADLVQKWPEHLGHIDPDIVGCAAMVNDKPDKQKWDARIVGVREPEALWSKKTYCLYFYMKTWEEKDEAHRAAMLFEQLLRVSLDCDGKVLPEDLKGSYILIKAFGPDFSSDPKLPNLLKEKPPLGVVASSAISSSEK